MAKKSDNLEFVWGENLEPLENITEVGPVLELEYFGRREVGEVMGHKIIVDPTLPPDGWKLVSGEIQAKRG